MTINANMFQTAINPRRHPWFFAVSLLVVGTLFGAAEWEASRQEHKRMQDFRSDVDDKAELAQTIFKSRLSSYDATLLALREIYVADPAQFAKRLQWLRQGPLADRELLVVVIDRAGYVAYTDAPGATPRLDLRDARYFRFFADDNRDRFYADGPVFGRVTRRHTLPLARPIYDKNGAFDGVIALSVLQLSLANFGSTLRLSGDTTVSVVTERGAVVTRSRELAKVQGTSISAPRLAQLLQGDSGVFSDQSTLGGGERIIAFRHLEGVQLIVYVSDSTREVMAVAAEERILLLSGAGVFSLLVILLLLVYLQRQNLTAKFIATQQAHLKDAQRIAKMSSWELDLATRELKFSEAVYPLFGIKGDHRGYSLERFLSNVVESDRAGVAAAIEQVVKTGSSSFEYGIQLGDGKRRIMAGHGEALRDKSGKVTSLVGTVRDITESKQQGAALNLLALRSEVLLQLPAAAETRDERSFIQLGLELAEQLTGSQISFLHFVQDDQEHIELATWSQATLEHYCTAISNEHLPISQSGIWADALRQCAPVLINDYANASGKHGLPEGHARLDRLISVPVLDAGLVRMMMGVGNKPQDFNEFDVETTRLIADAIWRIVHQRRVDGAMRKSQASLKEAQFIAGLGSYAFDVSTGRWESSDALDSLFGIDATYDRSVLGWEVLIHPDDRELMDDYFKNEILGQHKNFDKVYRIQRHSDQAQRWVHGLGLLEFDAAAQVREMHGTIQDITDRRKTEEQIQSLAFSDPLTGLPNRRLLMDRLDQAITAGARHQRQGALLYIDLDDFKTLNDTFGHDQGDLLLQQVAQRLLTCVREGDTVARLGGDEFVVLLEDLSKNLQEAAAQAETVSKKIIATLIQPYQLGSHTQHSTSSIGITLFGGTLREAIAEPLKHAELAMYQAKAAGHNTLRFFEAQMQAAVTARATLEASLREALEKNQFLLHYQAQVTDEGWITGVEALVRWFDPKRGTVSPAEFIGLAEETGLILPLGQWVLESACNQLKLWASQPALAHLSIAVNVSARQFHQRDFVAQVLATLARTGAKPQRLKLELTESLLVSNVEDVIAKMNALKGNAVGFSLDDFGTGYSSLSYLKRLPLDQLKIDISFVRDILIDANDAAIARMVIVLAESLGLAVIAEGVETEAQRAALATLGCHAYQGYLFSKPLPINGFEALARKI